jgi:hypothetical protein
MLIKENSNELYVERVSELHAAFFRVVTGVADPRGMKRHSVGDSWRFLRCQTWIENLFLFRKPQLDRPLFCIT